MGGRLVDMDASKFNYDDCLKSWFMLQDVTLLEHGAVPGFVFVFDMKGASLGHVTRMSLSSIKKYYMYIQVYSPIFSHAASEYKIYFVLSTHPCSCCVVTLILFVANDLSSSGINMRNSPLTFNEEFP
jgi:hypothetical protein